MRPIRLPLARAACAAAALATLAAPNALADMYRYRDPETGKVKLTNIPPPWLNKPALAANAPRTEVIRPPGAPVPASTSAVAAPAPAGTRPPGSGTAPDVAAPAPGPATVGANAPDGAFGLDRQRKLVLQQMVGEAQNVGTPEGKQRFFAKLGEAISIESRLDAIDPAGKSAREAERGRAIERCTDGWSQALKDPAAKLEFAAEMVRWMGERVALCARGAC
jgi:hypothetical protein